VKTYLKSTGQSTSGFVGGGVVFFVVVTACFAAEKGIIPIYIFPVAAFFAHWRITVIANGYFFIAAKDATWV